MFNDNREYRLRQNNKTALLLLLVLCTLLQACTAKTPPPAVPVVPLVKIEPPSVIHDDKSADSLVRALDENLKYLNKLDPMKPVTFGEDTYSVQQVKDSVDDFKRNLVLLGLSDEFFKYVRDNFDFYRSPPDVLFTGYFEASLRGALKPDQKYRFPLYSPPEMYRFNTKLIGGCAKWPDETRLQVDRDHTLRVAFSRNEIDYENKLAGRNLELVWTDDPVANFFLHIQGSGIVTLPDGQSLRVNFADKNGHPYRAIGALLIERGILSRKDVSMQSIKKYLYEHPEEQREIFNYNPSYVFFRTVTEGPIGSIGVRLTPYRSIATDHSLFPKGAIALIETEAPVVDAESRIVEWVPFQRFVLNQDTGGAIRGATRADLFTGYGPESELVAGHLKNRGQMQFIIKKK